MGTKIPVDLILRIVSSGIAIAMERIQQGKYAPPTVDELKATIKKLEALPDLPEKRES